MRRKPTPFRELTHRGQVRRLRRVAQRALGRWGLEHARLVTLDLVENATFRVEADRRFLLRIQLPVFKKPEEVRSELAWLDALRRDTDLTVPRAVPSRSGETVVEVATDTDPPLVFASVLQWIPGRIHARKAGPSHLRACGALMARLHEHAVEWTPPEGFVRYDWRARGLFGGGNDFALDRAEIWTLIAARHRSFVRRVEDTALAAMEDMEQEADASGLFHADLHPANLVMAKGGACPIDFEDCGTGHWIYDLAVPAAWCLKREEHPALVDALVDGYRSVRPFPGGQLRHLRLFQAVRVVSNALWIADHSRELAQFRTGLHPWIDRLLDRARRLDVV